MDNTTIELVKQLGEKIELYGSNLFEIAMKQQMVYIVQSSITLLGILILLGLSVICFKKMRNHIANNSNDNYEKQFNTSASYIVQAIITLVLWTILQRIVFTLIQWYLNPEYQAIIELTKLIP